MKSILKLFLCCLSQVIVFSLFGQEDLHKLRVDAENGNADAQYDFGTYLFAGEKIKEDQTSAVKLFAKAAAQGHAKA